MLCVDISVYISLSSLCKHSQVLSTVCKPSQYIYNIRVHGVLNQGEELLDDLDL